MLDHEIVMKLREMLQERRHQLMETRQATRDSLDILQTPEIEREETASKQTISQGMEQLETRELEEIQAIDTALSKIENGSYGDCDVCGKPISVKRLHAMPWVSICIRCARQREPFEPGGPIGQVECNQIDDLTDQDIERLIWDELDRDEKLQTDNLEITSSNGTVTLSGTLPNKAQHQSIREIIQDRLGFDDLVEHLEIVEPGTVKFAEPKGART